MLKNIIEDMWYQYDDDCNGCIDKSEFNVFIRDVFGDDLKELLFSERRDIHFLDPQELEDLTQQELDVCFSMFDIDGNGVVTKDEMLQIFKQLTGL